MIDKKRYRIVVEHVNSGNIWYGKFTEMDIDELYIMEELIEDTAWKGNYLTLEVENGGTIILPKNLIQECIFRIEESKEND